MAKKSKKAKAKTKTKKRKTTAKTKKAAPKKRSTAKRDPCAAQRANLKRDQDRAAEIRDFLPDAPASEKPRLNAELKRLEQQVIPGDIRRLQECERLHPSR